MRTLPIIIVLLCCAPAWAGEASFTGLGKFAGDRYSIGFGSNADGSVIVGASVGVSVGTAFRWTEAGLEPISGGHTNSSFRAASADGNAAAGFVSDGGWRSAILWTDAGGMEVLPPLGTDGNTFAYGISADGSTVVGGSVNMAFAWTRAGGTVPLFAGSALGISADGTTVVGSALGGGAVRWTQAGGAESLGYFFEANQGGHAMAASDDGSVIVGSSIATIEGWTRAFRWQGGTMTALPMLPDGFAAEALGVSADGSMVYGTCYVDVLDPVQTAFVWDAVNGSRAMVDVLTGKGLDMTGWSISRPVGSVALDSLAFCGNATGPGGDVGFRAVLRNTEGVTVTGSASDFLHDFSFTGSKRTLGMNLRYDTGGDLNAQLLSRVNLGDPDVMEGDGFSVDDALALADRVMAGLYLQAWNVDFAGEFSSADLVFRYDEWAILSAGVAETDLKIWHFTGGKWIGGGTVDPVANTITVTVDSFSPFILGVDDPGVSGIPEPATLALLAVGLPLVLRRKR